MYVALLLLLACPGADDKETGDTSDTDTDTDTDFTLDGAELYARRCSTCHGDDGHGTRSGPDITGEISRVDAEIVAIILGGEGEMDPIGVSEAQAQLIVDWMQETF